MYTGEVSLVCTGKCLACTQKGECFLCVQGECRLCVHNSHARADTQVCAQNIKCTCRPKNTQTHKHAQAPTKAQKSHELMHTHTRARARAHTHTHTHTYTHTQLTCVYKNNTHKQAQHVLHKTVTNTRVGLRWHKN